MRVLTLVIVCVFLTMYNCYYLTQQTVLLRFLFVPDHQMIQIEHNSVIPRCTNLRCNDWLFENHNKTATTSLAWPGPGPGPEI